jgi:hypothetical protein
MELIKFVPDLDQEACPPLKEVRYRYLISSDEKGTSLLTFHSGDEIYQ